MILFNVYFFNRINKMEKCVFILAEFPFLLGKVIMSQIKEGSECRVF